MGGTASTYHNRKNLTLIVAGQKFLVDKSVLALHSPVFSKTLDRRAKDNELIVDDMDVRTAREFIRYVYERDTRGLNTPDMIIKVLIAAKTYEIQELESITSTKLENIITNENAICMMKLATKYDNNTDILMFIIRVMVRKGLPVVESHEMQEFYETNSAITPLLIQSLSGNQRKASSPIEIPRRKPLI